MHTGKKNTKFVMRDGGFTLIELCVAIVIFAVGITGVVKMQMSSSMSNSFSMQLTDATNTAQNKLEVLSGLALTNDSLGVGSHASGVTISRGVSYEPTWEVTQTGDARLINMRVAWNLKGTEHSLKIPFVVR